jgi:hypothetical protein
MSLQVHFFNDVQANKIKFSKRVYKDKLSSKHCIDAFYENSQLFIQTPQFSVQSIHDNGITVSGNNPSFVEFIKKLEEQVIHAVYKHADDWFNGKRFTLNKIKNSLVSKLSPAGESFSLNVDLQAETKFFNQFKQQITSAHLAENADIILLLRMRGLSFSGSQFTYDLVLEQAKVYCEQKLDTYSLIEDNQTVLEVSEELEDEYYKSEEEQIEANEFFSN